MADAHKEAMLYNLKKTELTQLFMKNYLKTYSSFKTLATYTKELIYYFKKLLSDITIMKSMNDKLVAILSKTNRQC